MPCPDPSLTEQSAYTALETAGQQLVIDRELTLEARARSNQESELTEPQGTGAGIIEVCVMMHRELWFSNSALPCDFGHVTGLYEPVLPPAKQRGE